MVRWPSGVTKHRQVAVGPSEVFCREQEVAQMGNSVEVLTCEALRNAQ